MRKKTLILLYLLITLLLNPNSSESNPGCFWNGIYLSGRVQFVNSFPDIRVQFVNSFPDLKVKWVNFSPNACGEWQEVSSFPDIRIQIVNSFPDLKIQEVNSFPGIN